MSRRSRRWVVACALGLALTVAPTAGQWGRSAMNGMVFDDSDTHGIAGVTVELFGDAQTERLRDVHLAVLTDVAGKYTLERVPYGRYEFRVSAAGYLTYSIPLYVASDALTQIHVQLLRAEAHR